MMMMSGKRGWCSMIFAVTAALMLTLSSCMQEVPIVSLESGNETTNMTLDEQREWVGEQLDAAIKASGTADGWFDSYDSNVLWAPDRIEDRRRTLDSLFPRKCGAGGRLVQSLINTSAEDPFVAADVVRAFWESEGWTISNIHSYGSDPYFRADRDDGAILAFRASSRGVVLEVETACSVHETVTNWRFRGNEKNSFTEELERRDEGAEE